MKHFQVFLNLLGYSAIGVLGALMVFSYFNLGISFKEVAILVGLPLTVGIFTRYAVF